MRHGITRLEVLVVAAICLLGGGLAVMFLAHHRENALRVQCTNNLKQIGLALHTYEDVARSLPPSRIAEGYATWGVLLAPHLAKDHPLQAWDAQQSYFAQKSEVREARLIQYFCPARPRIDTLSHAGDIDAAGEHFPGGLGDYACVAGDGSAEHDWTGPTANGAMILAEVIERKDERILQWKSRTSIAMFEQLRGKSYTMLAGEKHVPADRIGEAASGDGSFYNGGRPASFSRVAGPGFPIADSLTAPFNNNFGSYHRGVCHFLFADKSVRPMSYQTSEFVLGNLARRTD